MRKPRCAEAVPIQNSGHITAYAACNKPAPCELHPGGKIDTVRDVVRKQAKWKRDARRKR